MRSDEERETPEATRLHQQVAVLQQELADLQHQNASLKAQLSRCTEALAQWQTGQKARWSETPGDARMRSLIEQIADPVVVSCQGIVRFVNQAAEQLFGRPADDLLHHELGIPIVSQEKAEVDIVDYQGMRLIAELRIVEIAWEGEAALLVSFRDITAHKHLEEELERRVEQRTQELRIQLRERERAERAILYRDTILEAVEFAARRLLKTMDLQADMLPVLEYLGTAAQVSRVAFFTLDPQQAASATASAPLSCALQSAWVSPHWQEVRVLPIPAAAAPFPHTLPPRWIERLRLGDIVYGDTREFPQSERELLEQQAIRSLAIIPIFVEQTWWGGIAFEDHVIERSWSLVETEAMQAAANIIGSVVEQDTIRWSLRESEERFRLIADFTFDWAYWIDTDGRFRYVSSACESLTGYSPHEFQQNSQLLETLVHPDDQAVFHEHRYTVQQYPEKSYSLRFRIIRRDGQERWMSHKCQPIYGADGRWLGRRCSNRDVTEQVHSEQLYRTLVDYSLQGLFIFQNSRFVFANPYTRTITGYSVEELLALSSEDILALIHPDDRPWVRERIQSHMAGHIPSPRYEYRIIRKDGQVRWIEVFVTLIQYHGAAASHVTFIDITDRKRTEEVQRKSEAHFRAFVEGTDNLVCQMNDQWEFTYVNQSAERVFGVPQQECIGKSLFAFVYADDRDRTRLAFDGWLQRGATHATFENRQISHQGTVRHMLWTVNLLYQDDGCLRTVNAIARDITEYKQIEQTLRESESRYRMISGLISDFAYALRREPDETLLIEWVTDAFLRTTGFSLEEVNRRGGWESLIHPDDRPVERLHREWLFAGQWSDVSELRIITRDGHVRWLRNHTRPVWDSRARRMNHIYGAAQDVTDQKRAADELVYLNRELKRQAEELRQSQVSLQTKHDALYESEERYRHLVELSPDMIVMHCEGSIIFINQAGMAMLGGSDPELFLGRAITDIVSPSYRYLVGKKLPVILGERGYVPLLEGQFMRLDGSVFDVEVTASPFVYQGKTAVQLIARDITERKRIEQALRESEQKFRSFFEQSQDGLVVIDDTGTIVAWNKGAQHIWGLKHSEVVNRPVWDVLFQVAPADHKSPVVYERTRTNFLALLKQGRVPSLNQWAWRDVERPDGTRRMVQSLTFPIRTDKGLLLGNITRDITAQKEAEEGLRASEARHRMVWETATDAMVLTDPEGIVVTANPSYCRLYGYTMEEIVGHPFTIVVPGREAEMLALYTQAFADDAPVCQRFEEHVTRSDGQELIIESHTDFVMQQGRRVLMLSVIRDITERKRTEEALRASEARFRMLAENIPDVIYRYRFHPTFHYEYISPSVTTVMGYTPEEYYADPFLILRSFHPEIQTPTNITSLHSAGACRPLICYFCRKDGREVWIEQRTWPVYDDEGNLVAIEGISRDITEQKKAEDALVYAQQEAEQAACSKSEFLANMSHEIRTPLNAIIGMTTLIRSTPLTARQYEFVETIRSGGETLLKLINDILDFSKIEAGKLLLEHEPFDLCACIDESINLVDAIAAEKEIEMTAIVAANVPRFLVGDVTRVRQILVNLLGNGVKFTEQGEVVVRAEILPQEDRLPEGYAEPQHASPSCRLHLQVRDTGIGISEEGIARLFESFSQVDASTTRKYGGTGLGLAISKRLAELMEGSMWVESEIDHGTTFHVTLLLEVAHEQAIGHAVGPGCITQVGNTLLLWGDTGLRNHTDHASPPVMDGKRVLLVKQDSMCRQKLVEQVAQWGFDVHVTDSGYVALDWLRQGATFDLALLDGQLVDMDGDDLANAIQAYEGGRAMPLVLLAFAGRLLESTEPEQSTFAAVLHKPIKPMTLYESLCHIFSNGAAPCGPLAEPVTIDEHMGERYPLRILLAEDDAINQKVALLLLERMGYHADVAASGGAVLNALRRQWYDVVFMDVQMPDMDGIETTRYIRTNWAEDQQPWIVAMTAYAMEGDRERCLDAGMNEYMSKPIQLDELVAILVRVSETGAMYGEAGGILKPVAHAMGEPAVSSPVRPAPALTTDTAVDGSVLQQFVAFLGSGGANVAQELIAIYLADTPDKLHAILQGLEQRDGKEVLRLAHTLKTSSAQIGAMALSQLCRELEACVREDSVETVHELVNRITAEYARVEAELHAFQQLS